MPKPEVAAYIPARFGLFEKRFSNSPTWQSSYTSMVSGIFSFMDDPASYTDDAS